MPYPKEHKHKTRQRIIEAARKTFNERGFADTSIDDLMAAAGLTRGGFYKHFATKDELYAAAIESFVPLLARCDATAECSAAPASARKVVDVYLSREHLLDPEGHCPMVALPSDVARAGPQARAAYEGQLNHLVSVLESGLGGPPDTRRQRAVAAAALCIGGMVAARTIADDHLRAEILSASRAAAESLVAD